MRRDVGIICTNSAISYRNEKTTMNQRRMKMKTLNTVKIMMLAIAFGSTAKAADMGLNDLNKMTGVVVLKSNQINQAEIRECNTSIQFNLKDDLLTVSKEQLEKCEHDPDNSSRTYKVRTVPTTVGISYVGDSLEDPTFRVRLFFSTLKKAIFFTEEGKEVLTQASMSISEN